MSHNHNSSHFDDRAAGWDDDAAHVERARAIAAKVRQAVPLSPEVRLLEYGAGTALVAQELAADVGPLTLVEPSAGMRKVLADKINSGVLPSTSVVWDLDLSVVDAPDETVDLIVTAMTLHHIPDVPAVLRAFAALLSPGGRVCVADLFAEDGSFHDSPDFDVHHGFDPDEFSGWLQQSGFSDVDLRHAVDIDRDGRSFPVFLITATRD